MKGFIIFDANILHTKIESRNEKTKFSLQPPQENNSGRKTQVTNRRVLCTLLKTSYDYERNVYIIIYNINFMFIVWKNGPL